MVLPGAAEPFEAGLAAFRQAGYSAVESYRRVQTTLLAGLIGPAANPRSGR